MTIHAIRARNLGKAYRLDAGVRHDTLRDLIMARLRRAAPQPAPAGDFWALRGVGFDIEPGETVGIIGRNGSGKSTLLRVLSRITPPTEGEAVIRGRCAALLEVGTGFHPELSGLENIRLNAAILGVPRREIDRRLDGIIEFAGITDHLHEPLKRYSTGMRTRLGFAVAAHLDPDVLIVDEVLAVADADFQKRCLGVMRDGARDGRTVLLVSHDDSAVRGVCDRVIWIERGRVREDTRDVAGALRRYHRVEAETPSVWVGDAAPDAPFAPTRLAITDATGAPLEGAPRRGASAYVRIEGDLRDPTAPVPGYALRAADGQILYASRAGDGGQTVWPPRALGRVVLRSRIPVELLNTGTHSVELATGALAPTADAPRVSFRIAEPLGPEPAWTTPRPGLIAPALPWEDLSENPA